MKMKKFSLLLFVLTITLSAFAQSKEDRFFNDVVKIRYRWTQENPGTNNIQYAFHDVDRDGTPEMFVKDEEGNKGMFWYSGNIIKYESLGIYKTGVTFWPRFIVAEGSVGTGVAMEILVEMKKSRIINSVFIEKEFDMETEQIVETYDKGYTKAQVKAIRNRIKKKQSITFDDLSWAPLELSLKPAPQLPEETTEATEETTEATEEAKE